MTVHVVKVMADGAVWRRVAFLDRTRRGSGRYGQGQGE